MLSPWCAGAVLWLSGCGKHQEPGANTVAHVPVAQVRVAMAESKRQPVTEEVAGTVRSTIHATLEAKVSGRIREMPLRLGQTVKAGDLVARLDAGEVNARLEQAQASLEQAERDWNRISSLFKGQAVTRSEYDSAESRQRLAKAAVAEAEAMMRYAEIVAPFDGVVSHKWADVGDFASPGKPLIEIEDPSLLQLEADVPEGMAAHIQPGTPLAVRLDGLSIPVQGKVDEMAPSADPASRTVRIKVALVQTPGLMPGRFARLLVPVGESSNVEVPTSALVRRGQLEMVFVVTNQHARLHLVKTGKQLGDRVAILSGLDAGDAVAADRASLLADGQPVEVK
jgi:RND family efflux transporter MFP subunit